MSEYEKDYEDRLARGKTLSKQLQNIEIAEKRLVKAQDDLRAICAHEFPVGCRLRVTLGRAIVDGTVLRHSGIEPGYIHIRNDETGKERKFYAPGSDAVRNA